MITSLAPPDATTPAVPRRLIVVLPAYNEEESISLLLESIFAMLSRLPAQTRIIVVDDGSRDATPQIVRSFAGRGVDLIQHLENRGLHEAVRSGMLAALQDADEGDIIVVMDADNTHHPELIPQMVAAIGEGADVVIASRFAPGGRMVGAPLLRRVYSKGARWLLHLRFRSDTISDYTCGYRAYRAGVLNAAFARWGQRFISMHGFACMLDILLRLRSAGARIVEVPLVLRYDRKTSPSKLRVLSTIANTIKLIFR